MDNRLFKFVMPLASYDRELLPEGQRDPNSPEFGLAVSRQLTREMLALGIKARIVVNDEFVEIEWDPNSEVDLVTGCVNLLRQGMHRAAVPLLQGILMERPDEQVVLFNLGMALSDLGKLDEAIEHLARLVKLAPNQADAHISLAVALIRKGETGKGITALEQAIKIDPQNAYAHRNLGAALMQTGKYDEAFAALNQAALLSPNEPGIWFGVAQAAGNLNNLNKATDAYKKVIALAPDTSMADAARTELNKMAEQTLRNRGVSGVRPDVMEYCIEALKKFAKLSNQELGSILLELATKGNTGLDINDPTKRYSLESLEGDFSGLKIVTYMYVASQRLLPGQDVGIDLSKEYQLAKSLMIGQ
ncbi:MAG: tetratricopeptide repeat protein [Pirellulaceae bacterium]